MPNAYARGKMTELTIAKLLGGTRIGNTGKRTPDVVTPKYVVEVKCVTKPSVKVPPAKDVYVAVEGKDYQYRCGRLADINRKNFFEFSTKERKRFLPDRWFRQLEAAIQEDKERYKGLTPMVAVHVLGESYEDTLVIRKIKNAVIH